MFRSLAADALGLVILEKSLTRKTLIRQILMNMFLLKTMRKFLS
jgi:hypothetical protein